MKIIQRTTLLLLAMIVILPAAQAALVLDDVQYDPAIVAAGDEVDIVIQYHDDASPLTADRLGDPDYRFEVRLEADDALTRDHVLLVDPEGDNYRGFILSGGYYNKRFRIKVLNDAPAANYEFKLSGQWYREGVSFGSAQTARFRMPVKKEGIILDIASIETEPAAVRPGDDFVRLVTRVENVGQKDAKRVEVWLDTPDGVTASYSDENRRWIGRVNAGEAKELVLFLDVDEEVTPGVEDLSFSIEYMDLDDNSYSNARVVPFRIMSAPRLEVISSEGSGLAGGDAELRVTIKNVGTEAAEAVDIRLLKQSAQPFTMDARSDFLGELEPGEERTAVFTLGVNRDAALKEHDFQLLIRAKGDSDEGDDNIYTFTRRASLEVTGKAPNKLLIAGIVIVAIIIIGGVANIVWRRRRK